MKISEILCEQDSSAGLLPPDVAQAIPNAQIFPELGNQDPYLQYRFGLAMAAAGAVAAGEVEYDPASAFGENLTVVSQSEAEEEIVRIAQSLYPRSKNSKLITSKESQEAADINKVSPVSKKRINQYGV